MERGKRMHEMRVKIPDIPENYLCDFQAFTENQQ